MALNLGNIILEVYPGTFGTDAKTIDLYNYGLVPKEDLKYVTPPVNYRILNKAEALMLLGHVWTEGIYSVWCEYKGIYVRHYHRDDEDYANRPAHLFAISNAQVKTSANIAEGNCKVIWLSNDLFILNNQLFSRMAADRSEFVSQEKFEYAEAMRIYRNLDYNHLTMAGNLVGTNNPIGWVFWSTEAFLNSTYSYHVLPEHTAHLVLDTKRVSRSNS